MQSIFFRPDTGVLADVIPFYRQGDYHLFYLYDSRSDPAAGPGNPSFRVPWLHLVTRDFVRFEAQGEAIPRGAPDAQDDSIYTGCVFEHAGRFHIFYTGHNPKLGQQGKPTQGVMRAVSTDLRTWRKIPEFLILPPSDYKQYAWRDPFVFWNDETMEYWMLLCARKLPGPSQHSGVTALLTSKNLDHWEVRKPFWEPDEFSVHECPDLFRIGEWWYLVFYTADERGDITLYRMSRSLDGPWLAPADDSLGGHGFSAAKTASDGERRFAFGWLPTREDEKDDGKTQWGGELVVHEIAQQKDDTLAVRMPDSIRAAFTDAVSLSPRAELGPWKFQGDRIQASSVGRFSAATLGALPEQCLIETTICFEAGVHNFGLLLRADDPLERCYRLRFDPPNQRMAFERRPDRAAIVVMVERPLAMSPGQPIPLRVIVDGTCLVAYANDRVALSARMYDYRAGRLGLFVTEGIARFDKTTIKVRR